MDHDLEARVTAKVGRFEVVRQLHAVPPHEVYEVRVNGRRAVLKRDRGPTATAGIEARVMACIGHRTEVPVPEILLRADDFYVAEWHPQAPSPGTEHTADETWARAAGRGIARLHQETAPHIEGFGIFQLEDGELTVDDHARWAEAVGDYLHRRRRALEPYGHADMAEAVAAFLKEQPDRFAGTAGAVCCHGWATPEHVAVDNGEVACLIDFEHAIAAPGEFDIWRTALPLFGPSPDGSAFSALLDGYESIRPLPDGFERRRPLYRLLNGVYYLESLYVQDQHGPAETADRAEGFRTNLRGLMEELE